MNYEFQKQKNMLRMTVIRLMLRKESNIKKFKKPENLTPKNQSHYKIMLNNSY